MTDIDRTRLSESLVRREVPGERRGRMLAAAAEIEECDRVLEKGGSNVVADLLRGQGAFTEWNHYPPGDVYDSASHGQYYYHAHPSPLRETEHGHFHTFLRVQGMPKGVEAVAMPESVVRPLGAKALSHLIGISMDWRGRPIRLFTVNRWVTGESWYPAGDVIAMLDRFEIDHANPSWPVNRWTSAMLRLFRPQIEWLIGERDQAMRLWQAGRPDALVYEDRELEVTSSLAISVADQMRLVREP